MLKKIIAVIILCKSQIEKQLQLVAKTTRISPLFSPLKSMTSLFCSF